MKYAYRKINEPYEANRKGLRVVMFVGPPASGKKTQSTRFKAMLDNIKILCSRIDMGQSLTDHADKKRKSIVAKCIERIKGKGKGLPEAIPIYHWIKFLDEKVFDDENPDQVIVMDGVCRKKREVKSFAAAMRAFRMLPIPIIEIDTSKLPKSEYLERFKERGRPDDNNEEYLNNRVSQFEKETLPVIHKLAAQKGFHWIRINGAQSKDQIFEDIAIALYDFYSTHYKIAA